MCGRYTLATPSLDLVEAFDVPSLTFDYFARFNIAPGQQAPVVAEDPRGRRIGLLEWGLLPAWKSEPKGGFINARAESVATKPSFREAFARRRCLVPADGFYEWRRDAAGVKTPFWIHPAAGGLVSFAGLWESWTRPGVEPRHTFMILTTEASGDVREIHDRMPAVIRSEGRDAWLDRATLAGHLSEMLRPAADGTFVSHEVGTAVNRAAEDGPELIEALPG